MLITHYDLIMRDKAFLKKIDWFYMIVDEGHRLKNHECALARTLVSGYDSSYAIEFLFIWILMISISFKLSHSDTSLAFRLSFRIFNIISCILCLRIKFVIFCPP